MATFIPKELLTPELKESILDNLIITKENNSYSAQNFRVEPEPIKFYMSSPEGILIPYSFATIIMKNYLNLKIVYPKSDLKFIGQLRENQISVYEEVIADLKAHCTVVINVPPGFGKTILGAKLRADLGYIMVVLVHRESLAMQWKKTFENHLVVDGPDGPGGKRKLTIWIPGDNKKDDVPEFPDIIICMDQRTKAIPVGLRKKVGILLVDEAHCFCTETRIKAILSFEPKYVIAETATLERSDELHRIIQLLCGKTKVHRPLEKVFKIFKVETNLEFETETNRQGKLDWNALVNSMCGSDLRNEMICKIVIQNPDKKILILTSRVEHVRIIKSNLIDLKENVDTLSGKKKNYKDSRILIGTISKIGTGFDEQNACEDFGGKRIDLVILATSIKDLALLEQNIGRGFRSDNPVVYDLVDRNRTLKSHFYIRQRWYLEKGGTVETFKISVDPTGPLDQPEPKNN